MSRLLDDLLDVSRITRGKLELRKSWIELASIITAAVETARPVLDAKHHVLSLDLPRESVRLEADPVRMAQVFANLLINAAKYTDPGGRIQLRAWRSEEHTSDQSRLHLVCRLLLEKKKKKKTAQKVDAHDARSYARKRLLRDTGYMPSSK